MVGDESVLGRFLWVIYETLRSDDNSEYRRRWKDELCEIYGDSDIVLFVDHVIRLGENTPDLKIFEAKLTRGRSGTGRPLPRLIDHQGAVVGFRSS